MTFRRPLMQAAGLILFALLLAVLYRQWDYFFSRSPLLGLAALLLCIAVVIWAAVHFRKQG